MDLDAIEQRAAKYAEHTGTLRCCNAHDTADDVPALVARVRELEDEAQQHADDAHKLGYSVAQDELKAARAQLARATSEAQQQMRELEEENQRLRDDLEHATKFVYGTTMENYATVTHEPHHGEPKWFVRSFGPTERHPDVLAALARARDIAKEEAPVCGHKIDGLLIGEHTCVLAPHETGDHQGADGTLWENLAD